MDGIIPVLNHTCTARAPVSTAGVAGGPRARGRALGRVVSVAVSAVGVADRGGASAGTVFVTARSRGRLMSGQQKQKKGHHHERRRRAASYSREVLGHDRVIVGLVDDQSLLENEKTNGVRSGMNRYQTRASGRVSKQMSYPPHLLP